MTRQNWIWFWMVTSDLLREMTGIFFHSNSDSTIDLSSTLLLVNVHSQSVTVNVFALSFFSTEHYQCTRLDALVFLGIWQDAYSRLLTT